jgi:hypothetical protein
MSKSFWPCYKPSLNKYNALTIQNMDPFEELIPKSGFKLYFELFFFRSKLNTGD